MIIKDRNRWWDYWDSQNPIHKKKKMTLRKFCSLIDCFQNMNIATDSPDQLKTFRVGQQPSWMNDESVASEGVVFRDRGHERVIGIRGVFSFVNSACPEGIAEADIGPST
jgi:hypothetical protein